MKILMKRRSFKMNDMELLTKKPETCDIATKRKLFEEFQVSVEKKLLELEAAIASGCNG